MRLFKDFRFIFILYILLGITVGIQQYLLGSYNNFTIFRHSVFHFFDHLNPYLEYPREYDDLFLYNPSFIIFFIPIAFLPISIGIPVWAVLNVVVFYVAIKSLPVNDSSKFLIYYLIIPELIASIGNLQTNTLIAAFIILSMTLLEKNNTGKASIFPALNFFIKGYGGIAAVFFLLKKPRNKSFVYLFLAFLATGILPLLFYSFEEFKTLYQQWFSSLSNDYTVNVGVSVMALVKTTLFENASVSVIQLIGVALFLVTLAAIVIKGGYEIIKYNFLPYVLIWVIIFNHAAEPSTYVIASTGALFWYVTSPKKLFDKLLIFLFFIITEMSFSDLFPRYIREHIIQPYALKSLPCLLIWLRIQISILKTIFNPKVA